MRYSGIVFRRIVVHNRTMLTSAALAARTVAVVVSREHNARIYNHHGWEDLDSQYSALKKLLQKARLLPAASEHAALYQGLMNEVESNPAFAKKLDALFSTELPSKLGQMVTFALSQRDQLPEAQWKLVQEGEHWIVAATASWPDDLREKMRDELEASAHLLHLFTNVWLLRRLVRLLDPAHLSAAKDLPGVVFPDVLDEEMEEIEIRRNAASVRASAGTPQQRADDANLIGLAFSGGGIRSATFNLGVLQFLGDARLLRRFDYLSTVSGGGYIGAWLHAWIHDADRKARAGAASVPSGIDVVEEGLSPTRVPDPRDERTAPIRFLRRYSNYLTPQTGMMSADTWTMLNIWLRNTFLNMVILALALSAILVAPRWMSIGAFFLNKTGVTEYWWVLLFVPACLIGLNLATFHRHLKIRWVRTWLRREPAIFLLIVAPIFLASWGAGTYVPNNLLKQGQLGKDLESVAGKVAHTDQSKEQEKQAQEDKMLGDTIAFAVIMPVLVFLVSAAGRLDYSFYPKNHPRRSKWWRNLTATGVAYIKIFVICCLAAFPSWSLAYLALDQVRAHITDGRLGQLGIITLSAPAFLILMSIVVFLFMGLLGRRFPDDRREWMARLGGWLAICCVAWVALCGTTAYGPVVMEALTHAINWTTALVVKYVEGKGAAGTGINAVAIAVVLLTVGAGLAAGHASSKEAGASVAGFPARMIARMAPPVFVAGLLLVISWLLAGLADPADAKPDSDEGLGAFIFSAACGLLALFLSSRVDINEFSLHQFYRNRIVRCYMGGARCAARVPDPFTGFDGADDFPVSALAPSRGYSGPYAIFNTTLNVTHGDELAWQERKGEAFAVTPGFSGFSVESSRATEAGADGNRKLSPGGYRTSSDYAYPEEGVSVGTAVAISGAAASPNQGRNSSVSTAFLMTVLNVRLGWWLGNPRRKDGWQKAGPKTGLFQLVAELIGSTNDTGKYVNLSDGGHFENLAVYELVRRRCRFIVACDSEEDHRFTFGGLGNLIRKCRTDFGVEIEISTTNLTPAKGGRYTLEHCALGKISYPSNACGPAAEGTLIYIKSSLTGDESTDVMQYSQQSSQFPHESTADQWFDESQFESYRKLGFHAAESAREMCARFETPAIPVMPVRTAAAAAG